MEVESRAKTKLVTTYSLVSAPLCFGGMRKSYLMEIFSVPGPSSIHTLEIHHICTNRSKSPSLRRDDPPAVVSFQHPDEQLLIYHGSLTPPRSGGDSQGHGDGVVEDDMAPWVPMLGNCVGFIEVLGILGRCGNGVHRYVGATLVATIRP